MTAELRGHLAGKKVLFATTSADGYNNPLTGLAKYLQEAGCDVRWYAPRPFAEKLTHLGIPHFRADEAVDFEGAPIRKILARRQQITDPMRLFDFDITHLMVQLAPLYLADIEQVYQVFPFEAVFASSTFSGIPLLRAKLQVPVLAVSLAPLAEESIDLAPYGTALAPAATDAERATYATMRQKTRDLLFQESTQAFDAMLSAQGIAHEYGTFMDTVLKQADLVLQVGVPGFEYTRRDLGSNVRFIGALQPYVTAGKKRPWFDDRLQRYEKVVLVTQGTVESDLRKLVQPTLAVLQNTDLLVIAVTGGHGTSALRQMYGADNIIIEDYIPFDEVLPYVNVCVTNGGYGSALLSLAHNVPIVAAGLAEGRNEVCARIDYFKCGLNLRTETPSPRAIGEAVIELLTNRLYWDNAARLAQQLGEYDANELSAGYLIELLAGNSSTK